MNKSYKHYTVMACNVYRIKIHVFNNHKGEDARTVDNITKRIIKFNRVWET